jgi:hypothetical protein
MEFSFVEERRRKREVIRENRKMREEEVRGWCKNFFSS